MAVIDDRDPVRDVHDLVELEGYEQDRNPLVPLPEQHPVDVFDRAHVQAARGLDGDQEGGVISDLPADDDLLLVAAREAARHERPAVARPHVIGLDQLIGKASHLFSIDRAARRKFLRPVFFHDGIFID